MRPHGFTLIEVLVAVAIIAALAAILLPSYRGALASSDTRNAQLHAQGVRLALDTLLASNPQLTSGDYGNVDCTQAQDVTPGGPVASNGGNGWPAAPSGNRCTATALNTRSYRVAETLQSGQVVTVP